MKFNPEYQTDETGKVKVKHETAKIARAVEPFTPGEVVEIQGHTTDGRLLAVHQDGRSKWLRKDDLEVV